MSTFSVCADRSIISGGRYSVVPHILRLLSLPYQVLAVRGTEPKVTELDGCVVDHQDVLRLDVSM